MGGDSWLSHGFRCTGRNERANAVGALAAERLHAQRPYLLAGRAGTPSVRER